MRNARRRTALASRPGPAAGARLRVPQTVVALLACLITGQASAGGIHCPLGDPVTADLGDGVIMRTCLWEKAPQLLVRAGPLELIKNGVLILKTQTNRSGKLHGKFTSWDDNGKMIESGVYDNGLKEGPWSTIDEHGISRTSYYRQGVRIEP